MLSAQKSVNSPSIANLTRFDLPVRGSQLDTLNYSLSEKHPTRVRMKAWRKKSIWRVTSPGRVSFPPRVPFPRWTRNSSPRALPAVDGATALPPGGQAQVPALSHSRLAYPLRSAETRLSTLNPQLSTFREPLRALPPRTALPRGSALQIHAAIQCGNAAERRCPVTLSPGRGNPRNPPGA